MPFLEHSEMTGLPHILCALMMLNEANSSTLLLYAKYVLYTIRACVLKHAISAYAFSVLAECTSCTGHKLLPVYL